MFHSNNLECTIDSLPTELFNLNSTPIADGEAKKIIMRFATGGTVTSTQSFTSNNFPAYDNGRANIDEVIPYATTDYFVVWVFRVGNTIYQTTTFDVATIQHKAFIGLSDWIIPTGEAPPDNEITIRGTDAIALNRIGDLVFGDIFKYSSGELRIEPDSFDPNYGTGRIDDYPSYGFATTGVSGKMVWSAEGVEISITP